MKNWFNEDQEYKRENTQRERIVELIVKDGSKNSSTLKLNKTISGGFLKKLPPW